MTLTRNEQDETHFSELFFLGFIAAGLIPALWAGTLWVLMSWFQDTWRLRDWIGIGAFTCGFHQWIYVLPSAWFLKRGGHRGLFWGLLSGAGIVLLANILGIAFAFFASRNFD